MNAVKGNVSNAVLMTIVGLLVGLIAGYWIGRGEGPRTATGSSPAQSATANCPHKLEPEDVYILAGFRCPGTADTQALLSDCHCAVAHGIEDMVKSKLAGGKSGEQIRAELIGEYGDRLKFTGQ